VIESDAHYKVANDGNVSTEVQPISIVIELARISKALLDRVKQQGCFIQ
jgi:hypothetical protein